MSKELEAAAIDAVGPGDGKEFIRAFKAGAAWAIKSALEVKVLVEACEKERVHFEITARKYLTENAELRKERDELIASGNSIEGELRRANAQVKELQSENAELKRQLGLFLASPGQDHTIEVKELFLQKQKLESEFKAAKDELEDMKDVYYDIVKLCEASGTEDVRNDLKGIVQELAEMKQQLEDLSWDKEWIDDLKVTLKTANKQIKSLEQEIERLTKERHTDNECRRNEIQAVTALLEKCENKFKSLVGFEPFHGLEPRIATEALAEIAKFRE